MTSHIAPTGTVTHTVTRDKGTLATAGWRYHLPNWLRYRRRDLPKLVLTRTLGVLPGLVSMESQLQAATFRMPTDLPPDLAARLRELLADNVDVRTLGRYFRGVQAVDYGVVSTRVVTDAGVGFIVDAFQNLTELENMKYHGYGTGGTAEAANQTALVTELTTQYVSDSTRPTGTTTENAANIYETVATLSPDSGGTIAITEHGIFSASSAGTMLDRSLFTAINLVAGSDSLQTTYRLTLTSGS